MSERIDNLKIDLQTRLNNLFIDSPADWLVQATVDELKKVEQWTKLFGTDIEPYQRMDFPVRETPCMRLYNYNYERQFESWYIEGDLVMDMIWPASIRRAELQRIPDVVASAMLQQFRRTPFFNAIGENVPGLNELGKRFNVDKSLMFEWGEEIVPLTQIRLNFRIDIQKWDDHLEQDNRTIDDPFKRTLKDLERIAVAIEAFREPEDTVPELIIEGVTETDGETIEDL